MCFFTLPTYFLDSVQVGFIMVLDQEDYTSKEESHHIVFYFYYCMQFLAHWYPPTHPHTLTHTSNEPRSVGGGFWPCFLVHAARHIVLFHLISGSFIQHPTAGVADLHIMNLAKLVYIQYVQCAKGGTVDFIVPKQFDWLRSRSLGCRFHCSNAVLSCLGFV